MLQATLVSPEVESEGAYLSTGQTNDAGICRSSHVLMGSVIERVTTIIPRPQAYTIYLGTWRGTDAS